MASAWRLNSCIPLCVLKLLADIKAFVRPTHPSPIILKTIGDELFHKLAQSFKSHLYTTLFLSQYAFYNFLQKYVSPLEFTSIFKLRRLNLALDTSIQGILRGIEVETLEG